MALYAQDVETKQSSIYRSLNQGITVFHEDQYAEVDIVAVPGLGANPEESWTWTPPRKRENARYGPSNGSIESVTNEQDDVEFNWIRDAKGIASLASLCNKKSRIMLYDFASAWKGSRKVRATLKSICTVLLDCLSEKRKGGVEVARPLIFIGHSMGGLVIAKTICIAKSRREYEAIATCTVGCAFFGTPFRGTSMARLALLYSSYFGQDAYEALLTFMQAEKNDSLDEVTTDFVEICNKFVPPIDLFCAYEEVPIDPSKFIEKAAQNKAGALLKHKFFKAGASKFLELGFSALSSGQFFVERESAILQGAHSVGITAGHSDLVKFKSIDSPKFDPIKKALRSMIEAASVNARKRIASMGKNLLTQKFVNSVRQSLEGVDMRQKCRTLTKQREISSWLIAEKSYEDWKTSQNVDNPSSSFLWVRGGPGLGKTNAALAAIQQIDQDVTKHQSNLSFGQSEVFLACFLCEWKSGYSTAEELLKSLIVQIINQEDSLAQHAKLVVPSAHETGIANGKATATVVNLWKCLQDMINDPVTKNIYIVISNIHCLEPNESTFNLLQALGQSTSSDAAKVAKAKWLLTSRNDRQIIQLLAARSMSVIDLENDKAYGAKVRIARQKHAKQAVAELRSAKRYSADLAYFIRNSIENQSEDEKWIDVLCLLLKALPGESSSLSVQKWLWEVGDFNLNRLVDHAWRTILDRNDHARLEIEEVMRILTIVYENPTLADLCVLTQIDDLPRMAELVRKCSPIILLDEFGDTRDKVVFTNDEFRQCLFNIMYGTSDTSSLQPRRYHGLLALRCFKYIKSSKELLNPRRSTPSRIIRSGTILVKQVNHGNDVEMRAEGEEESGENDDSESTASESSTSRSLYAIKYLFRHLSRGFSDVAEELCEDDPSFWGYDSQLRAAWLIRYQQLMNDFKDLDIGRMTALHVAAGIGATELVSLLVARGGETALSYRSSNGMTALHVAAWNNHAEVVEVLLRTCVQIDTGNGEEGTPLHFAALRGNCSIMDRLIGRGADVNAFSEGLGPVINAAIRSGKVEAVKMVMEKNIRFDLDHPDTDSPLSLAAAISDPSLFEDILEDGKNKWLQNPQLLDQALFEASSSGRLESVRILLKFEHTYSNATLQRAISSAAQDKKWDTVNELLDHVMKATHLHTDIKFDDVLYLAAISRDDQQSVLNKIWTFKETSISRHVCDFALYEVTVLQKTGTLFWLLETCEASPNATAERPPSLEPEYPGITPAVDYRNVLNAAASTGNIPVVKSLIQRGASIDTGDDYALQLAAKEGHCKTVEALIECGATVDRQVASSDTLGFFSGTALQAACDNIRTEVVRTLISNGANPNLGGGQFTNPITAATQKGTDDILTLLLSAPDIDVNVTGGENESTPLINAANHMSTEAVSALLEKGADVNAENAFGDTALIMAAFKGNKTSVELLCSEGADVTHRSPTRGLAIQVAAEGLHPSCAHTLAEKMGKTISDYQEEVKFNHLREDLRKSKETIQKHTATIEALTTDLAEKAFDLEEQAKEIKSQQVEKEKILTRSNLFRESYKSMEQQLSAMEQERKEIRRQRDTFDEQVQLANSDSQHLEGLLAAQKEANAAVRKRHGYTALEEAKDAAVAALADEQATRAKLEANVARLEADAARAAEEMAQLQATVDKLRKGRAAAAGDAPEQSPGLSQGLSSPELVNGGETPPWSQPGSPDPRQSFRTVHGQHRPDGSFGGYRNRYGSRRPSGAGELDGVKRTVSWQSGTLEEERELYGRG